MTMAEMSAIAFKHFKGTLLKGNKAAHIKELGTLIAQQPRVLQLAAPSPVVAVTLADPGLATPVVAVTLADPGLATPDVQVVAM